MTRVRARAHASVVVPGPRPSSRWTGGGTVTGSGTAVLAALGSLLLFRGLWPDPLQRSPGAGASDPVQTQWFLAWVPHALLHGQNPFLSDHLFWPHGVNVMWNASVPLAGLLAAPLTLTLGPVAAYDVLLLLAPVATAWTARLWLGRHVPSGGAAAAGALLVAFCPFVAAHAQGHLNLVLLGLVPVVLLLVEDVLWRRPGPRSGALLGLAVAGQALTSEEVLLMLGGGVAVALGLVALARPRAVARALRRALPGVGIALVTALVLLSPALLAQLAGPDQVPGLVKSGYSARLADLVVPTDRVLLHGADGTVDYLARASNETEVDGYLGWPLLVLLVLAGVLLRDLRVRVGLGVAAVVTVLSLGPATTLGGRTVRLPWARLFDVYGVRSMLPSRFALVTMLAAAVVVALVLDRVQRAPGPTWAPAAGAAALLLAMVPLIPRPATGIGPTHVPAFFTAGAPGLPTGSPVLVLPLARPHADAPMLWQAITGMRFRLVGGYALNRAGDPTGVQAPVPDALVDAATAAADGRPVPAAAVRAASPLLAPLAAVVVRDGPDDAASLDLARRLTGRPSDRRLGGVQVWDLPPS